MTLDFSPPPVYAAPMAADGDLLHSIWEWEWEGVSGERLVRRANRNQFTAATCGGGGGYMMDTCGVVGGAASTAAGCGDWSNEAPTHESVYKDILDLLPSDPFGMELGSTWTAAIAGWLEDLREEYQPCDYCKEELGADYDLFAGINFLYNNSAWLSLDSREHGGKSSECSDEVVPVTDCRQYGMDEVPSLEEANIADDVNGHAWVENPMCISDQEVARKQNLSRQFDDLVTVSDAVQAPQTGTTIGHLSNFDEDRPYSGFAPVYNTAQQSQTACSSYFDEVMSYIHDGYPPHEGLFFALRYLEVQDLLSVERVCKGLRSAVRNDSLLWKCIHISQPLNERLTDDALFQLCQRADGKLRCLNLVHCSRITNDGLSRILSSNPFLTKLSVPGCRLSVDGLVDSLKLFNAADGRGIKYLRIGGLYGVTQAHYDELKQILGMEGHMQERKPGKPRFYLAGSSSLLSCDYDDALDIELCPICQNLRVVYDCPSESCREKKSGQCRGCNICISRCVHCGRCLKDRVYEETFYLDCVCLDCLKKLQSEEAAADGGLMPMAVESLGAAEQQADLPDGLLVG